MFAGLELFVTIQALFSTHDYVILFHSPVREFRLNFLPGSEGGKYQLYCDLIEKASTAQLDCIVSHSSSFFLVK